MMEGGDNMKNFEIIKLGSDKYMYMVIATTCISPISTLADVQNELENTSGQIIFDLTLINGTNSNRYISASFENGVFDRRSFELVKTIDPSIKHISSEFFIRHADTVKNGTIPNALKSLLVTGAMA